MTEKKDQTTKAKELTIQNRELLKATFRSLENAITDQKRGDNYPPMQKEYNIDDKVIELEIPKEDIVKKKDIFKCILDRQSIRKFSKESLSKEEVSYLLWATQGKKKLVANNKISLRTVPSGGARHPFETYLAINNVENLKKGIYRYHPLEHKIVYLFNEDKLREKLTEASYGQSFVGDSAVVFIWSTIPYRCEWRYLTHAAKLILQDSGHICQNLYIAAESIECGTCAIGAYSQELFDKLLKLDGKDEFVIYLAPVGKKVD